jgi:hypothetical protein
MYLTLKNKDETLLEKRRPIFAASKYPTKSLANRTGRAILFHLQRLGGHFNLWSTQSIVGACKEISEAMEPGDRLVGWGFDVKEMFNRLPHTAIIASVGSCCYDSVEQHGGEVRVSVPVRGRGGVLQWVAGRQRASYVTITVQQIMQAVEFSLRHIYGVIGGTLLRQTMGIGMGGSDSPALAQCVCVHGEREWTQSCGRDAGLVYGMRIVDDVNLFIKFRTSVTAVDVERAARMLVSFIYDCYPEEMTVESTSTGQSWEFCGLQLDVQWSGDRDRVVVRQLHKNVNLGVKLRDQRVFFPIAQTTSYAPVQQQLCTICSLMHRIQAHTSCPVGVMMSAMEGCMEMRWAGVTWETIVQSYVRLSTRYGGIWQVLASTAELPGTRQRIRGRPEQLLGRFG